MKSMTGYGAAEARTKSAEISVIVKSVNGRFLDSRFHLPREFFVLESTLKKKLQNVIQRGTVDIFIQRKGASGGAITLNKGYAGNWVKVLRELAQATDLKVSDQALFEKAAAIPQVFEARSDRGMQKGEESTLLKTFTDALKKCDVERTREGKALQSKLLELTKELEYLTLKMEELRAVASQDLERRFKERLKKMGLEKEIEPSRFAQELILQLDRVDIAEEIARLKEHLVMCGKVLRGKDIQGKKLDFYSQELLREVNTIGSKANLASLTDLVVQAKGLIESFKEQVQNIE